VNDRYSLVELAALPQEEALRRRREARNSIVVRWLVRLFALAASIRLIVILAGAQANRLWPVISVLASLTAAITFHRVFRRSGARDRLVMAFVFAMIALPFLSGGAGGFPWLMLLPFVTATLRLETADLFLLHGFYLVAAVVVYLLTPATGPGARESGLLVGALVVNALVLAWSAWTNRRFRRGFLEEWGDVRGQAQEGSRMRREIESARDVQLAMLPSGRPSFSGYDVAALSIPATEVGGDYFDFFETGGGRLAVVAADVAGHGLASGIVLSGIRSGLTLLAGELDAPGPVLSEMNRMVRATNRNRMLVTLAILLLDARDRTAAVVNAGHPPVLVRRAASGEVEELPSGSLPLGSSLVSQYPEHRTPFAPGDVFLLHSDGIYETAAESGESYGFSRLSGVLGAAVGGAEQVGESILADVTAFRGAAQQTDDITLVVVKIL
jgi:serine phosphatase RsbU (regulator of sigma subunit)